MVKEKERDLVQEREQEKDLVQVQGKE